MTTKRKQNSAAHHEGRRAFHRFALSQRAQAEIAIESATGQIGKLSQTGTSKWSTSYADNWEKGWNLARSEVE